jgi:hypothetical protein
MVKPRGNGAICDSTHSRKRPVSNLNKRDFRARYFATGAISPGLA